MPDIKLKIGGDTTELERAFTALITKMKSDADKLKLSPSASQVSPRGEAAVRNTQLADLQSKQYGKILKDLEKELSLIKEIGRERERLNRQEHIANIQKANFVQTQRAQGFGITGGVRPPSNLPPLPPIGGGGSSGGFGGSMPKGGITSLSGLASAIGVPGAAIGGVATAIAATMAAEGVRKFISESSQRARVTEASAFQTQGQGGQRLSSLLNGGAAEEMMFNPQRLQAASIAAGTIKGRYSSAGLGAPFPMALGSAMLGPDAFGSLQHGNFPQAFRAIGGRFGISGLQKEFESKKHQELANEQASQFEALKTGPGGAIRTAVGGKFLSDWRRNLDFQRQTGMSDEGFRGGFLGGVHGAGFSDEQGMGMSSGILGAGGSTRAATGNAGFALQMQRAFGLTNSGQAMGQISGQLGSSQLSKEALIKIQAEGTRIGVNQSEFQEENRKFVDIASAVLNQSTATSGAGVDQIVSTLGAFMGSKTMTGMEAGRNAYQAYQSQSNIQSGPSAAMRAAGIMRDPALRKLTGEQQAALFTMNQADVNPDDLGVKAMAKDVGLSPEEFVKRYHGVQEGSRFNRKSTDKAVSQLKNRFALSPERMEYLEGQAQNLMAIEQETSGLGRKGQLEAVRATYRGGAGANAGLEADVARKAAAGETGRTGDEMERQQAQASRLANELFMQIKDSITPASEAAKQFANDISALTFALSRGTAAQKQAAIENFQSQHGGLFPANQPSTGPTTNGAGQGPGR